MQPRTLPVWTAAILTALLAFAPGGNAEGGPVGDGDVGGSGTGGGDSRGSCITLVLGHVPPLVVDPDACTPPN